MGVQPELSFLVTQNENAPPSIQLPHFLPKRFGTMASYLANTPRRLKRSEVVHNTFYHPRFLHRPPGTVKVSTLHDMIPEQFPHLFGHRNPHLSKKDFFNQSDLIICVSETSRDAMREIWPEMETPTSVIPLGVDDRWFLGKPAPMSDLSPRLVEQLDGLPAPFVVFVGSRDFHKDFNTALEAINQLRPFDVQLIAVGGGDWTAAEQETIRRLGLTQVVKQLDMSDDGLMTLLPGAVCLLMTSRAEGFGLPLLEAFARGTPVVAADIATQREFGGGLPLLFEPGDFSAASEQVLHLLNEPKESRLTKGVMRIDHARRFTWGRMAKSTAEAYQGLV
jgi:glycosyltransferase involved in cell wall biosynthesis